MDYCISSAYRRRNDFQKADRQGENPFAKGFSPWTPFPKTPKWLRRGPGLATDSLIRTRPKEACLEFFAGEPGGGLLARKSPPDSLRSKRNNPLCKKGFPGSFPRISNIVTRHIVRVPRHDRSPRLTRDTLSRSTYAPFCRGAWRSRPLANPFTCRRLAEGTGNNR